MEGKDQEKKINDSLKGFQDQINSALGNFDGMLKNLMPQSPARIVEIEVVKNKGFFGIGRVVKKYKMNAYISMNNVLCLDFVDKNEMKEYFDGLK